LVRLGPFDVSILAADSMGVRSLATVVNACGVRLGLDLGASLAPRRYGLPPHELELKALERALKRAAEEVQASDATRYNSLPLRPGAQHKLEPEGEGKEVPRRRRGRQVCLGLIR